MISSLIGFAEIEIESINEQLMLLGASYFGKGYKQLVKIKILI
jgi:hypothetical protein